jgi:ABC-type transport system involved in cytochrome c biogenesis permease subunit
MVKTIFILSLVIYILAALKKRDLLLAAIGFSIQTVGLAFYTKDAGHLPLCDLYEFALSLSWFIACFGIFMPLVRRYAILLASSLLIYTIFSLGSPKPLLPALQSYWLYIHVTACLLSYTLFFLSFVLAIAFLFKKEDRLFDAFGALIKKGFFLLTLGICTGSIWAHYAWGRWWGWDPKEVWALITWLYYTIILHLRLTGCSKRTQSILTIGGVFFILFTFLGVSFLPGLHSYF